MTDYRVTYEVEITQPENCEKGGWKVIKAETADEALKKFKKRPPFAKGCISFTYKKLEVKEEKYYYDN
jgi:hypothetical protein